MIFELVAVGLPAWIDLSVAPGLGLDGVPTGDLERIVCLPVTERMQCSVQLVAERQMLRITARLDNAGQYAALNIGWHRSVATGDRSFAPGAPSEVSATWAYCVAWT